MASQPIIINNSIFSKQNASVEGDLSVDALPRVEQWLGLSDGLQKIVHYHLVGFMDGAGQRMLNLKVAVDMVAPCQRCFGDVSIKLALDFDYMVTHMTEEEILVSEEYSEQDETDWLTENKEMDVLALIEDEMIAALPYSPAHENACVALKVEAGEKPNPFSVLKGMIDK